MMTILKNKWALISMILMCWALTASFMTGYYYYQYDDLLSKAQGNIILTNVGINYSNGSATYWHNETKIKAGSTLLEITKLVASVNYTGSLSGALVNTIDGVPQSDGKYWLWWTHSSYGWTFGQVACDKYVVGENETLFWYREVYSANPQPPF